MTQLTKKVIIPEIWKNDKSVTAAFSKLWPHNSGNDYSMAFHEKRNHGIIESNRKDFLELLGLNPLTLATAKQVHGNHVQVVTDSTFQPDTDALVTSSKNVPLGILVADCAAVLLADRKNGVVAAVHAGWRGAVQGIIEKAIEEMIKLGAGVKDIEAFVSPCIGLSAFEVGNEVAEKFPDEFVDYQTYKKPHVDLKKFVIYQLVKSGLISDHIECHTGCTFSEAESLHSYRRDKESSGRMMAVISLI